MSSLHWRRKARRFNLAFGHSEIFWLLTDINHGKWGKAKGDLEIHLEMLTQTYFVQLLKEHVLFRMVQSKNISLNFVLWSQVTYFFDPDVGNFHFGPGHPMKVAPVQLTHLPSHLLTVFQQPHTLRLSCCTHFTATKIRITSEISATQTCSYPFSGAQLWSS